MFICSEVLRVAHLYMFRDTGLKTPLPPLVGCDGMEPVRHKLRRSFHRYRIPTGQGGQLRTIWKVIHTCDHKLCVHDCLFACLEKLRRHSNNPITCCHHLIIVVVLRGWSQPYSYAYIILQVVVLGGQ